MTDRALPLSGSAYSPDGLFPVATQEPIIDTTDLVIGESYPGTFDLNPEVYSSIVRTPHRRRFLTMAAAGVGAMGLISVALGLTGNGGESKASVTFVDHTATPTTEIEPTAKASATATKTPTPFVVTIPTLAPGETPIGKGSGIEDPTAAITAEITPASTSHLGTPEVPVVITMVPTRRPDATSTPTTIRVEPTPTSRIDTPTATPTRIAPTATPTPVPPTPTEAPKITAGFDPAREAELFGLVNSYRAQNGLSPYNENAQLKAASRVYAKVVFDASTPPDNVWGSHTSPIDGSSSLDRDRAAGYTNITAGGENFVWGTGGYTAEQMLQWWKGSPGHNEAMLKLTFKDAGMGCYTGVKAGATFSVCVEDFGAH